MSIGARHALDIENNVVHNTIANKYSLKYNGGKITLRPLTVVKILREYIMRAERRKNEPFRKRMDYFRCYSTFL